MNEKVCLIPGCNNPPRGKRGMASEVCLRHYEVEKKRRQKAKRDAEIEEFNLFKAEAISTVGDEVLLAELERRGDYVLTPRDDVSEVVVVNMDKYDGTHYKIGVISDTHFCSQWQQLTHLKTTYKRFAELGITDVFHAGDLSDGCLKMHRGQEFDLIITAASAQAEYIADIYPEEPSITTHIMPGNHDESHYNNSGFDIVKEVCNHRDDLEYLGGNGVTVTVGGIAIYMIHPSGGLPYAVSYRAQKIAEQIAPEHKPHIMLVGHLHKPCHVPAYRNIELFTLSCFQSQTPYLTGKGLFPSIGGMILEFTANESGLVDVTSTWLTYYVPVENDYGFGDTVYIGNKRLLIQNSETPRPARRQTSKEQEVR